MGRKDRELVEALFAHGFDSVGAGGVGENSGDGFEAESADSGVLEGGFGVCGDSGGGGDGGGWGGGEEVVGGEPVVVDELKGGVISRFSL